MSVRPASLQSHLYHHHDIPGTSPGAWAIFGARTESRLRRSLFAERPTHRQNKDSNKSMMNKPAKNKLHGSTASICRVLDSIDSVSCVALFLGQVNFIRYSIAKLIPDSTMPSSSTFVGIPWPRSSTCTTSSWMNSSNTIGGRTACISLSHKMTKHGLITRPGPKRACGSHAKCRVARRYETTGTRTPLLPSFDGIRHGREFCEPCSGDGLS